MSHPIESKTFTSSILGLFAMFVVGIINKFRLSQNDDVCTKRCNAILQLLVIPIVPHNNLTNTLSPSKHYEVTPKTATTISFDKINMTRDTIHLHQIV